MFKDAVICIAEDDADDYSFIEDALKQVAPQSKLSRAKDGEELLYLLDQTHDKTLPSLIILDYNMPRLNGLQTLKLLNQNQRYKQIPKVFYSNGAFRGEIKEALKSGASAYFEKSMTFTQIKEDITKMLSYCGHNSGAAYE